MRQLRVVAAIGQTGSLTRAAERLGCTQSAISLTLKEVENEMGGALFKRSTRSLSPTATGTTALSLVDRLLADIDGFEARVRSAAAEEAGQVTFAAVTPVAMGLGIRVMESFARTHPMVDVRMMDVSPEKVLAPLQAGEAAFSIGIPLQYPPDIVAERLLDDAISVITRPGGPFHDRTTVEWSELADAPTIALVRGAGLRETIEVALAPHRLSFSPQRECHFLLTGLAMVRAGLGVLVAPSLAAFSEASRDLTPIPLVGPSVSQHLPLLRVIGRPLSPSALALMAEVKRLAAELPALTPV